jgi:hypothetical protein
MAEFLFALMSRLFAPAYGLFEALLRLLTAMKGKQHEIN